MAHPNEELARKGYDAFAAGDLDTIREILADDIQWHVGGRSPLAGDYKGKDEVFAFFAKLVELSGGTFRVDVHDVLANDEHAVVLGTNRATRDGKELNDNIVAVYHNKDRKTVEAWFHPGDQYATDEFWS
jgi:ketosteroid isomerase-like protein